MNIRGIDLSQSNAGVDYKVLKRLGYDFAILRDGFGWGSLGKRDYLLDAHYKGAEAAGMRIGYYHYIYSTDAYGAAQEALRCLENIQGKRTDLFIACDIEEKNQASLSNRTLTDMVNAFAQVIREAGYTPAVYSFASLLSRLDWSRIPEDVLVWAAHWGVDKPAVNHRVDCWQHDVVGMTANANLRGQLPGTSGDIDLNVLYLEEDEQTPANDWEDRYNRLVEQITELAENCVMGGDI